jgi:hypothetical protein
VVYTVGLGGSKGAHLDRRERHVHEASGAVEVRILQRRLHLAQLVRLGHDHSRDLVRRGSRSGGRRGRGGNERTAGGVSRGEGSGMVAEGG